MAVSAAMGFIKGKSAIHIAQCMQGDGGSFIGHISGRVDIGYRTVAKNEEAVRRYIRSRKGRPGAWINWS